MTELFMECATGLGGDMFLAATADLGLDLAPLEDLLRKGGVDCRIVARKERRLGLMGTFLDLTFPASQPVRGLEELTGLVDGLGLSDAVKSRSNKALLRLAEAEAKVHGVAVEEVHFHEIGALDTLIDVTGAFWALERLGVTAVSCAPLPWFGGTVQTEHGTLPLPAPATVELLRSKPVRPTSMTRELVTPTGAVLVDQMVERFTPGPEGIVENVGTGWGAMDLGHVPNGLRIFLLAGDAAHLEMVWVLETALDHLTGEELGGAIEALMAAGALDAIYIPGVMKKNRPGGLLQVLCHPARLDEVEAAIFAHTLTLGIRRSLTHRRTLKRHPVTRETAVGPLQFKEFLLEGRRFMRPEFEELRRRAASLGLSPIQLRLLLGGGDPQGSDPAD
jgi:pyridinium-3,5-bisthiocarboxylic acid mononucleotide nickel chelatase